jgi:hypothetical protein
MKKIFLLATVLLAFSACMKEGFDYDDGVIDASKIVFNIDVRNADAPGTKAVKTAWEDGDVVYAFFEGNTTQYVTMTYDGSKWTYTDKDGGTTFTDLTLAASGKMSAVYFPSFVCSAAPTYDTDKWTFGSVEGYFQKAESVDYTVTATDNVTTLNATLSLAAPANIMQFYISSTEAATPDSGNKYVLTATGIKPILFNGIVPGEAASFEPGNTGFPMTGYSGTIGSDAGYYFWGILDGTSVSAFDFQLVQCNAEKGYAISSMSKHAVPSQPISSSAAFKLTSFTDNGKFVSLGYAGCPLWATGNLDFTNRKIVDPLLAGEYFRYGATAVFDPDNVILYSGTENPVSTSQDIAYLTNNAWRLPTADQCQSLISTSNTKISWENDLTSIGFNNGGMFVTSLVNGLSLFFAAAGNYVDGNLNNPGNYCFYWTSTPNSPYYSAYLFYDGRENLGTSYGNRLNACSVRPVKN